MQNDHTEYLTREQQDALTARNVAENARIRQQAEKLAARDRAANGGEPSTRMIDGKQYRLMFGVIHHRSGHFEVCESWMSETRYQQKRVTMAG